MSFPHTVCCPPRFLTLTKYFRPIFADYLMSWARGGAGPALPRDSDEMTQCHHPGGGDNLETEKCALTQHQYVTPP